MCLMAMIHLLAPGDEIEDDDLSEIDEDYSLEELDDTSL